MPAPFLRTLSLDEQWHVSARNWHRLNVEPQQHVDVNVPNNLQGFERLVASSERGAIVLTAGVNQENRSTVAIHARRTNRGSRDQGSDVQNSKLAG
jgi:hypothetical protein